MTFVDAVRSPEGAIAIFRCAGCDKLFWRSPGERISIPSVGTSSVPKT